MVSAETNENKRRWSSHCRRMAEATYALADECDDAEMMGVYLNLAARWLRLAEVPPTPSADRA